MSTPHVHSCPHCYEHPICTMDCDVEPDLGTTPGGLPYGHTTACDRCGAPDAATELVDEFLVTAEARGFDVHQDIELFAALQRVREELATHHDRMAKARADLDLAICELSPRDVIVCPSDATLARIDLKIARAVLGGTPPDAEVGSRARARLAQPPKGDAP